MSELNWINVKYTFPELGQKVIIWVEPGGEGHWQEAIYEDSVPERPWLDVGYNQFEHMRDDYSTPGHMVTHWATVDGPK